MPSTAIPSHVIGAVLGAALVLPFLAAPDPASRPFIAVSSGLRTAYYLLLIACGRWRRAGGCGRYSAMHAPIRWWRRSAGSRRPARTASHCGR